MAYRKLHELINWKDLPNMDTPVCAENLNKMDASIYGLDDRVIELGAKADVNDVHIADLTKTTKTQAADLQTAQAELNRLKTIVGDGSAAKVFDTKSDLDNWLQYTPNTADLPIGTCLLIRELDKPDYWWDGTKIQVLESQKVDLSGYYTRTEADLLFARKSDVGGGGGGGTETPAFMDQITMSVMAPARTAIKEQISGIRMGGITVQAFADHVTTA